MTTETPPAPAPDDALAAWLSRRYAERVLPAEAARLAETTEGYFRTLYREVWREADRSATPRHDAAPSKAQWGAVRDAVLHCDSRAAVRTALFDPPDEAAKRRGETGGLCTGGVSARAWGNGTDWDPRPHADDRWREVAFKDLLEDLLGDAMLDEQLRVAGLAAGDAAEGEALRGQLARLAVLTLAHRMPRLLSELEQDMRKVSA